MMILRQADDAEVFQDVSELFWQKWKQYDPEQSFVLWAIRFAYFEALEWRPQQAREKLK